MGFSRQDGNQNQSQVFNQTSSQTSYRAAKDDADEQSPIQRNLPKTPPVGFTENRLERAHHILRYHEEYLAGKKITLPMKPTEKTKVVVIGGGLAGLSSAYLLRDQKPIILEQAQRFGGNARGESWDGVEYSIGSAYIIQPDAGSRIESFLREIGTLEHARVRDEEDPLIFKNKRYHAFHTGETVSDPNAKAQFKRFFDYIDSVHYETNGQKFPYMPYRPDHTEQDEAYAKSLDEKSMYEHMVDILGEEPHPHLVAAVNFFCWSAFATHITEISAASAMNFYALEVKPLMLADGGNAGIADDLYFKLKAELPAGNLRTEATVFDLRTVEDGVLVTYENQAQEVCCIHAEYVVMACPKMVVKKILKDIEPSRYQAISQLKYHAYLVANLWVDQSIKDDFYGLLFIGSGDRLEEDPKITYRREGSSDICYGNYAKVDANRTVISFYRSLPFMTGRDDLYAPDAFQKSLAHFEKEIFEKVLDLLEIDPEKIVDLRITRWGHAIPVAQKGLLKAGVYDEMRKPFQDRVYFVEQDNWPLPSFETALDEAFIWTDVIKSKLASK